MPQPIKGASLETRLLTSLVLSLTLVSCCPATSYTTAVPRLTPEQLLVDISAFPVGWYVDIPPHVTDNEIGQLDDRWVTFSRRPLGPSATQEVYCYRREKEAAAEYTLQMHEQFFNAERLTPWESPVQLPYVSRVAGQFRLACANFRDYPSGQFTLCVAMAQYNECLSIFGTQVSPEYMTFENLENVLVAIDGQAEAALQASPDGVVSP
jgi:hypothetical protein